MRCVAFCTAASYKLDALADYFKSQRFIITFYRNILHISKAQAWDIFIFPQGCFVTWSLTKKQEQEYYEKLLEFAIDPLEKSEIAYYIYRIGTETKISPPERFNTDIITIDANEISNAQLKLAISYGLVQSVKLESYEESIQQTIDNNSHIPQELAKMGRIPLPRKTIAKRIGEIFSERSQVNLYSEYFDVPEYFWQYPNLESYYTMTEQFLDVPKRVAALNRKLDVLHEFFEVLNNQLQHRHSTFLEAIIILLIFIEIVLLLIKQ